jgi:uncharacterized protein YdhG (YjbR/CyaY superfamily)
MMDNKKGFNSVDEYISNFPPDVQKKMRRLRAVIKAAAPGAQEKISYQMPAFALKGILVYFAAYKNHIGFYPTASRIEAFKNFFSGYKWSKGAVQFPLNEPLPMDLIRKIVKFKVAENYQKNGKQVRTQE